MVRPNPGPRVVRALRAVAACAVMAAFVSLLSAAPPARAATAITFSGPELLGKPTAHSITVNIVPDSAVTYYYEYGAVSGALTNQTSASSATAGKPSEVTIEGLAPNTKYYYRMKYHITGETDWVTRPEYAFWTQRARGSSFTFTVTSDGHLYTTTAHAQAWTNIKAEQPDFDIDLGDTFLTDQVTSQNAANARFLGQRKETYFGAISPGAAVFLASGNHEDEEGWNLDDSFSSGLASTQGRKCYYPTPIQNGFYAGNADPLARIDDATYGDDFREDYYAWEWGDVLFVVIDPFQYTMNLPFPPGTAGEGKDDPMTGDQWSWTLGAEQFNWLRQTLEGSGASYKFVFSHQMVGGIPRSVDGGPAGYVRGGAEAAAYFEWGGKNADGTPGFTAHRDPAVFGTKPIHQLLLDNGVAAYFHGHDHQYAYEKRDGIVYQEVPSPSMTWVDFPNIYAEGDHGDYQTVKVLPNTGHLRVQITPSQATVTYVKSNTGSSYTYTILPRPRYTLTTAADPAGGGTLSPATGVHTYNAGTVVTITAAPNPGYHFDYWTGDCAGSGICQVVMDANRSVTARFALDEYTLTLNVTGGGSVTASPDRPTYHYGDSVELTAAAEPGWTFDSWSGGLTGSANPASLTITSNTEATATFVDTQPPETSIDGGPPDPARSSEANFFLSSDDPVAEFECRLDAAAFGACVSPVTYTGLSDGAHTFTARAIDLSGNTDPTPASYTWTVDTSPFTLNALSLRQSPDLAAWSPVYGTLDGGYTVSLDPAQEWRYLDIADLAASHPLANGDYPFTLVQADLPAGWLAYWAGKGVTAEATEAWQRQMWLIINGQAPIFFLRVNDAAYLLVDALLHALGQPDAFLRVNGDYPLGRYAYTGVLTDVYGDTLPVTTRMTLIGPDAPAPPVVTVSRDGADIHLAWPAVAVDATGHFTAVTGYQVFRSPEPFFTPGAATLVTETTGMEYSDHNAAAAEGAYYYFIRSVNIVGPSADSNCGAAFSFGLSPGSAGKIRAE